MVPSSGTPMPLEDAVDGLMDVEKVLIEIVEKKATCAGTGEIV